MERREKILEIIKFFDRTWGQVPCRGFLAGLFKVSMEMIRKDFEILEREGKIERVKKDKYFTKYRLK